MDAQTAELLAQIAGERAALRAAIDAVPRARHGHRPAPDRWSARDVVEHIVLLEGSLTGAILGAIAEARASGAPVRRSRKSSFDPALLYDRSYRLVADPATEPRGLETLPELWRELDRIQRRLRAVVARADGLPLDDVVHTHHSYGTLSVHGWLAVIAAHEARHAAQIREVRQQLAWDLVWQ